MLIIEFIGGFVFLLALLTIYEACVHQKEIISLFARLKQVISSAKAEIKEDREVLSNAASDFNVGYSQGYKAALITAHMDSLHEKDGEKIKEKLSIRLRQTLPDVYLPSQGRMATPSHIYVDDDGGVNVEWYFGSQGAQDSWRVFFYWSADEGAMICKTTHTINDQDSYEGNDPRIGPKLKEWLDGQ